MHRPVGSRGAGPVERLALPNGMRVVARENPAAPVVAMTLFVRVGSRHETEATNGVTALLGRTVLKGTRTRSALEIVQEAESVGGGIESAADQEYSEIRAYGLARGWERLLALIHEVVTAPRLDAGEIERERVSLLAQIRGLEDQPFQVASRVLSRALYGQHPYGLPASGEPVSVGRLTRADLERHLEAFHVPGRMVLAVSGRVSASEVIAEAARLFGSLEGRDGLDPVSPAPGRPAVLRTRETRPTQQAQVLLGLLAPPIGDPDHVALRTLSAVLGSGMSSRLFRSLRDEAGLAYSVGAYYPTRLESSRLIVHIGTAPENVAAAEAGIRQELTRLVDEPVPDEELARTKVFLTGAFALDLRTNTRQSFYLGLFELLGVGHGYVARYRGLIDSVTSVDVQRVARRYLVEPAVVVLGPG